MVQRVSTVAFEGIEVRPVDVQVQVAPGMPAFTIVGLPDKAVSEARERVRSAMIASGLALPARRITINLAPADLPKEGSHYDLPIALGLMAAIGAIPHDALSGFAVLGELGLDGSIAPVAGVLPAAIGANARGEGLICPAACGPEAAWASPEIEIIAASSLIQLANHFKGTQVLSRPQPKILEAPGSRARPRRHQGPGKRQARARSGGGRRTQSAHGRPARRRQIDAGGAAAVDPAAARAGGASRSVDGRFGRRRDRGRRADQPAAVPRAASFRQHAGAGRRRPACAARAKSRSRITAFCFSTSYRNSRRRRSIRCASRWRPAKSSIARANHRVTYPARFMLVAAMNPCRCGHANDPGYTCRRGLNTRCAADYQARISGPLLDRIDLHIEVPAVTASRPHPAAADRRQPRNRRARGGRARAAGGALCRDRPAASAQQRRGLRRGAGGRGAAGR